MNITQKQISDILYEAKNRNYQVGEPPLSGEYVYEHGHEVAVNMIPEMKGKILVVAVRYKYLNQRLIDKQYAVYEYSPDGNLIREYNEDEIPAKFFLPQNLKYLP